MITSNWQVLKFGGTSVSTAENWQKIRRILEEKLTSGKKILLVHSALSQVSNRLEQLIRLAEQHDATSQNSFQTLLNNIQKQHTDLLKGMKLPTDLLDPLFLDLEKLLKGIQLIGEASAKSQAKVLAFGEILSTTIGHCYLQQQFDCFWLDARESLKVNDEFESNYLSANCEYQYDARLVKHVHDIDLVITQGFIASNSKNETCLLGRGGSDTSAANFAAKINAECLEIWTDVAGVFSANPKQVDNARVIKQLSYQEAQEMASAGAKVLHPRSIRPAQKNNIPIHIRSTLSPELTGTVIGASTEQYGMVKAITAKNKVTLLSLDSVGMWQQAGFLADIFAVFKQYGVSVDLVSTSETNVTVTLDSYSTEISDDTLDKVSKQLSAFCRVAVIKNTSAVSIVGKNVRALLHKIAPALKIFESYKVYLVSQSASDLNLTFVIDDEYSEKVIGQLHEILISNNPNSHLLGPTVSEMLSSDLANNLNDKWWIEKKDELKSLMNNEHSLYVYNLDAVQNNLIQLKSINSIDRVYYAVKANNNLQVLNTIKDSGGNFETVSIFEIEYLLRSFLDLKPENIFFTPNFAAKEEYQKALELGVTVSLDSSYPLLMWPDIFDGRSIFLRIDPNIGKGHHDNVRTAGASSKFGIPIIELDTIKEQLKLYNIEVIGLHAHAGSGILSNEHWAEHAKLLSSIAQGFPAVKYLNLGGGFGIKEKESQNELVMQAIDKSLQQIKDVYPQYSYWIEPGRYIVANTGVLLSKVTQVKQKGQYYYVGIGTGMNSLMRPALYGSYHAIHNLSAINKNYSKLATIVGPICESTDKLGIEIPFPETVEGDLLVIENVGAYGYVMSNQYNMRSPAQEVCL